METIKHICTQLAETSDNKDIKKLASRLAESFKIKASKSLSEIGELVYWLYIYDQKDVCFDLCAEISKTELTGDPIIDDLLNPIYTLYTHILREKGFADQTEEYISRIISSYRPKTLKRILGGSILYYSDIEQAQERGDLNSERFWKFANFQKLCFIYELGGSEEFTTQRASDEMDKLKAELSGQTQAGEVLENYSKLMQKGANDEEIEKLQATFSNIVIPNEFIDFYKRYNGQTPNTEGIVDGDELLSIDRILEEYSIWKDLVDSGEFDEPSSPDPGIKNDWYNLLWIPITSNGCGDNYCLDLDPTSEGTYGQMIRMWHDDVVRTVEAISFSSFLEQFLGKNYLDRMK